MRLPPRLEHYRWPQELHDEVLARLLDLNHRRAQAERLAKPAAGRRVRIRSTASRETVLNIGTGPGSRRRQCNILRCCTRGGELVAGMRRWWTARAARAARVLRGPVTPPTRHDMMVRTIRASHWPRTGLIPRQIVGGRERVRSRSPTLPHPPLPRPLPRLTHGEKIAPLVRLLGMP